MSDRQAYTHLTPRICLAGGFAVADDHRFRWHFVE